MNDERILTKEGETARINLAHAGCYAVALDGKILQAPTVAELQDKAAALGWAVKRTHLFDNEKQLVESGYLFRITDNGGETQDRFTIVTSDGDYFASDETPYSPLGFFQSGEGIDVGQLSDEVERGNQKDLRWLDLPSEVRRATLSRINDGFRDWIESEAVPTKRRDAEDRSNACGADLLKCIWKRGNGEFLVRDDEDGDRTFATMVEAVRFMLPDVHELSGPEYHSTVDLADETGGPLALWDCREDPPMPYEVAAIPSEESSQPVGDWVRLGKAHDVDHARSIAAAWVAQDPARATNYRLVYADKVKRSFGPIPPLEEKAA